VRANAVPLLVDIDPETLCMSVDAARRVLSPRTRAICVVHLYSSMADMDGFRVLAAEAGVPLIEDCAQAHGAAWRGARARALRPIGGFRMAPTTVSSHRGGGGG